MRISESGTFSNSEDNRFTSDKSTLAALAENLFHFFAKNARNFLKSDLSAVFPFD
jgi:hypothetical protein